MSPFAIDITKPSPTAAYYTVRRGKTSVWGGSPVNQSITYYDNSAVGTGTLLIDGAYRIVSNGNIEAWTIYQANATVTDYPLAIGEVKLVVCYQSGTDFKVRAIAEMSRAISMKGAVEFSISTPIAVQRNDLVGVWVKQNSKFKVGYTQDFSGSASTNLGSFKATVASASLTANTTVAATSDREGTVKMYAVNVRGTLSSLQSVNSFWVSDGVGDDVYGWFNFVSGTNAFPDANVVNPGNLFDTTNSACTVAMGTTGSVYYSIDTGAGTAIPVERFSIRISTSIPSDGRITVYTATTPSIARNLAAMQAVTPSEWVEVVTFRTGNNYSDYVEFNVGRLCTLIRLEMAAGAASDMGVEHFECRLADLHIVNGQVTPHPSGTMKDRLVIDAGSHAEAQFYTAGLSAYLDSAATVAAIDTSDPAFYAQINVGDTVYLRRSGILGQNNAYKAVVVSGKNASLQTLTVSAPGESFNAGDFIEPAPWWYQLSAYNNSNQSYAASNWISNHSCVSSGLRTSDPFSAAGK